MYMYMYKSYQWGNLQNAARDSIVEAYIASSLGVKTHLWSFPSLDFASNVTNHHICNLFCQIKINLTETFNF